MAPRVLGPTSSPQAISAGRTTARSADRAILGIGSLSVRDATSPRTAANGKELPSLTVESKPVRWKDGQFGGLGGRPSVNPLAVP